MPGPWLFCAVLRLAMRAWQGDVGQHGANSHLLDLPLKLMTFCFQQTLPHLVDSWVRCCLQVDLFVERMQNKKTSTTEAQSQEPQYLRTTA